MSHVCAKMFSLKAIFETIKEFFKTISSSEFQQATAWTLQKLTLNLLTVTGLSIFPWFPLVVFIFEG